MSSEPYSDSPSYVPSDSEISCDDDIGNYKSSSSEDNNNLVDIWNPTTATQRSLSFTGNEHLAIQPTPSEADGMVSPFDVYKLFVTEDVLSHIVKETNRYANQVLQSQTVTRKSLLSK